jgi:hypothetical protein
MACWRRRAPQANQEAAMSKGKNPNPITGPKGKGTAPTGPQGKLARAPVSVPRIAVRTKASAKGR